MMTIPSPHELIVSTKHRTIIYKLYGCRYRLHFIDRLLDV